MALVVDSIVLDRGLSVFAAANKIAICSSVPTTYAQANSLMLGSKNFGVGNAFGAISSDTVGRKVASSAISGVVAAAAGTPTCWAALDDANSRLLGTGPIGSASAISIGQAWSLESFNVVLCSGGVWTPLAGANIDLDFVGNHVYDVNNSGATFTDLLSCVRASSGYAKNSVGAWVPFAPNILRITNLGLLLEDASTNYLLNSGAPATQTTQSLATGDYCLWVEGSGSALASNGTATITGAASAISGVPNIFTVTVAGTVNVTVTGSVSIFQLEKGSFASSYISTTSVPVTRDADRIDSVGNLLTVLSAATASACVSLIADRLIPSGRIVGQQNGGATDLFMSGVNVGSYLNGAVLEVVIGGSQGYLAGAKLAYAKDGNGRSISGGGTIASDVVTQAIPLVAIGYGEVSLSNHSFAYIRRLTAWNSRLSNVTLQEFTAS